MLTVDEIKEKLIRTEKGKVKQTISNCMLVLRYDPILKKSICRNELTCKTDIIGNMPWKRRGINLTNTDENNLILVIGRFRLYTGRMYFRFYGQDKRSPG